MSDWDAPVVSSSRPLPLLFPLVLLRTVSHVLELDVLGVLNGGVADGGGAMEVVMGGHGWLGEGGAARWRWYVVL